MALRVPEDVLVERARGGDDHAFEALILRYQDRVYSIARSFVHNSDDALDLAQESFVKAYQGLGAFRGGCSFYTWLYRIVVNSSKDYLNRKARRPTLSLQDEWLEETGYEPAADSASDPLAAAEKDELCREVRRAVGRLPEKLRIAIALHDLEGFPQQDVAAIMGCPLGTAKSYVFRGRTMLRKMLAPYMDAAAFRA